MVQRISADAYIAAYVPVPGYIPFLAEENYGPRIERSEVWLLTCDDGDVGVAMLEERRDHLLLYSVAVRPTEQGRGHGRAPLDFADQRAAELGLAAICLYTSMRTARTSRFMAGTDMPRSAPAHIQLGWVNCSSTWCALCRRAPAQRLLSTRGPGGDC